MTNMMPYMRSLFLFPLADKLSGRRIRDYKKILNNEFTISWENRKKNNVYRLVNVLQNAKYEIPFYRDMFSKLKFEPIKILNDIRYFEELPIISKEDIREAGQRLLHPEIAKYRTIHVSHTNGSVGSALPIYYSTDSKDYSAAVTRICQEWIGFLPSHLQLHISSQFPEQASPLALKQEMWRQLVTNRISIETEAWTDDELENLLIKIKKYYPYLVQGHPSTMYELARYVEKYYGTASGYFKVFVSTGETLATYQRLLIENIFDCRVVNRYGNAEFGIIAHEKIFPLDVIDITDGSNHDSITAITASRLRYMQVLDPYVWIESLSTSPGQTGSFVVTDLTNYSSPLIRYATGDEGHIVKGNDGIYITEVLGRIHDVININGKPYPTHWFQDYFTRIGNIDNFQIVKKQNEIIELRICLISQMGKDLISNKLREIFPNNTLSIIFVNRDQLIRVGKQQKFRYIVDQEKSFNNLQINTSNVISTNINDRDQHIVFEDGWNSLERYGATEFRWMCKKGVIYLENISCNGIIEIETDYPAEVNDFPVLSIHKNNIFITQYQIIPGYQMIHVNYELVNEEDRIAKFTLEVSSLYKATGDYRELGLKVHSVKFVESF